MGQSQIKDSPFEIPLPQQRRINVSGTGVQPEYELGKSGSEKLSINIDMRLLEQASSGMKSTQIMPDVSSPVPVKAWMSIKNDKGEVKKMPLAVDPNNWTISFKPPVAAEHTIEIRVRSPPACSASLRLKRNGPFFFLGCRQRRAHQRQSLQHQAQDSWPLW